MRILSRQILRVLLPILPIFGILLVNQMGSSCIAIHSMHFSIRIPVAQ